MVQVCLFLTPILHLFPSPVENFYSNNYFMFLTCAKIFSLFVNLLLTMMFSLSLTLPFLPLRIARTGSQFILYHLLPPQVSSSQSQALVGERTSPHSWHHCLGHPALRTVNFVPSKFQLPVLSNKASVPCPICPQAKGHQLPFSVSKTYICNPLDLIYSDVWGLSPTISINGNRFYVSFVDVFSRFTWFYPI